MFESLLQVYVAYYIRDSGDALDQFDDSYLFFDWYFISETPFLLDSIEIGRKLVV